MGKRYRTVYLAAFLCRHCGEVFHEGGPVEASDVQEKINIAAFGRNDLALRWPYTHRTKPHNCRGGHVGLSDFIGFTKKTVEER